MGISRGAVKLIGITLREHERSGDVITFGVQAIPANYQEAIGLLQQSGVDVPAARQQELRGAGTAGERIPQEVLFRLLGFRSVESLDFYDAEKPTHVLDLNCPVPSAMHGRYDLVYDGGTTEHCFAVPTVLSNALRLTKPGGRIIHHLPLNNWVDHGFYQFSPTLFFDFYEANGCDELSMFIHFMQGGRERYIGYDPRSDGNLPYSLGRKAQVLAFFSARKAAATAEIVLPIQGRYRRTFGAERAGDAGQKKSRLGRLKKSILKRTVRLRAKSL
jgi:hypothetical protein